MAAPRGPIVIAYHIMWTLYGWWLPNDPRGSTSRTIRKDLITELGEVHFGRKRIQPTGKDIRTFYEQAAAVINHPLLSFAPVEFSIAADAIGDAIRNYTCYACAIMPDHVHLLIRRHRDFAEEVIAKIQALSRKRLVEGGLRDEDHPTWTRGGWKVFLDHPDEVARTIRYIDDNPKKMRYIDDNPKKMRLAGQRWAFVSEYDNWPLHVGHSRNSPYARALRAAGRYPR
jgi:REP element-mobilizing transposase RayT